MSFVCLGNFIYIVRFPFHANNQDLINNPRPRLDNPLGIEDHDEESPLLQEEVRNLLLLLVKSNRKKLELIFIILLN